MSTTLFFGSFDSLHAGHRDAFRQAAQLDGDLQVVVTRDEVVKQQKGRYPNESEEVRLAAVQADPYVAKAQLGSRTADDYSLLSALSFTTLAVGYDQVPDDQLIRKLLAEHGKPDVAVIRLQPFKPDTFKSSKLRHV